LGINPADPHPAVTPEKPAPKTCDDKKKKKKGVTDT